MPAHPYRSAPEQSTRKPRIALVTGAGKRLGRVIARELAREGWGIGVHYRKSKAEAESLAEEIRALGVAAAVLEADLADFASMRGLVGKCAETLGAPICLVNNASEFLLDRFETLEESTWNTHLDTNLKAPVFLARAMLEVLPDNVQGNIINIIDQRVWRLTPEYFSYTLSKSGLWTATQTLAQALSPRIRVNAIGPGPLFQSVHQSAEEFAAEQAATLLKHGPTPEEIADAIRFILATPSLTGQMIALDGGQHLS